jgi:hypothetical protein
MYTVIQSTLRQGKAEVAMTALMDRQVIPQRN